MTALIACYGPAGPQAAGDPRVAELLKRTVDGQHQATTAFNATLTTIQARGQVPWTAPVAELTLLHSQWRALVAWEQATTHLDAAVVDSNGLSDAAYRQCDMLCDEATKLSMRAITMQSEVAQGKRPGNATLQPLPAIPGSLTTVTAVWAATEAVYTRVAADLCLVRQLGVPPRMQKVYKTLTDSFQTKAKVFAYLQLQWTTAVTDANRVQFLRDGTPLAAHFYQVGQQVWTPYTAGKVYLDVVRSMQVFDPLQLPIDPWTLTDPDQVEVRMGDPASCRQLIEFWKTVADPTSAKALQDEINAAIEAEQATINTGRTFKIAPWQPRYIATTAITIGEQAIEADSVFAVIPSTVDGKCMFGVRVMGKA